MCANRRFASFLLVLVKHFEKTIINCFFSFTFSVFTLRRTQVRLSGEERKIRSSRNIVEMRTRHSLTPFLLISVTSSKKQLSTVFSSGTRYDHFDTSAYLVKLPVRIGKRENCETLPIVALPEI